MIAQEKINSVKNYLKEKFPSFELVDTKDCERCSWKFRVANDSITYVVEFERRFLDDTPDIYKALYDMNLSNYMKEHEGKVILVTTQALTLL